MNFHEMILNRILNWINFERNSNIELNQFGYRTGLTWRQLYTCQSYPVDWNIVGKLVEKQNLLWGSNIWQPFGEKWRVSALLGDKEMKISETRSGQKEYAYFINSFTHQMLSFQRIKEKHQCYERREFFISVFLFI